MVDRSFSFILLHFRDKAVVCDSIWESKSAHFLFLLPFHFSESFTRIRQYGKTSHAIISIGFSVSWRILVSYGPEQLDVPALIIHSPTSSGLSDWASERSEQCVASKWVNRWAGGPVLLSRFMAALDHSAMVQRKINHFYLLIPFFAIFLLKILSRIFLNSARLVLPVGHKPLTVDLWPLNSNPQQAMWT